MNHPNQLINVILSSKNEKSNRWICLIHGSFLHRVPCKQNIAATTSDERMPIPYLIPRSTTILGFEQYIYVCIPLNGSCVVHSRTKAMCLLGSHGVCAMYDVWPDSQRTPRPATSSETEAGVAASEGQSPAVHQANCWKGHSSFSILVGSPPRQPCIRNELIDQSPDFSLVLPPSFSLRKQWFQFLLTKKNQKKNIYIRLSLFFFSFFIIWFP